MVPPRGWWPIGAASRLTRGESRSTRVGNTTSPTDRYPSIPKPDRPVCMLYTGGAMAATAGTGLTRRYSPRLCRSIASVDRRNGRFPPLVRGPGDPDTSDTVLACYHAYSRTTTRRTTPLSSDGQKTKKAAPPTVLPSATQAQVQSNSGTRLPGRQASNGEKEV